MKKLKLASLFAMTFIGSCFVAFAQQTANDFVQVKGVSITGTETWNPESEVFVPERKITIRDLIVCDHEVTQGEYETYCKYGEDKPSEQRGKGDNFPAYNVNWYDAIVYCNLRSMAENLTPVYKLGEESDPKNWSAIVSEDGKYCGPSYENSQWNAITMDIKANGYRLPTEAEWEYLARGGETTSTTYSGSDTIDDVAWYEGNSDEKAHEVKGKKPNNLGLYDMSGNVFEWCWDCDYEWDVDSAEYTDDSEEGLGRCLRGGDWNYDASPCSVSYRIDDDPYDRGGAGFRVVRTALGNESAAQKYRVFVSSVIKVPEGFVLVDGKSFDGTETWTPRSFVFVSGRKIKIRNLLVSDHEVTQKEYETYCKYGSSSPSDTYGKGDNFPAYYVSWYDAIVYCNLRSMAENLEPVYKLDGVTDPSKWPAIVSSTTDGKTKYCGPSYENSQWDAIEMDIEADGYRLPTQAEWEYLARGGETTSTEYSGSNTIGNVAWCYGNSDEKAHEVKGKKRNNLGLYDMSGNVYEWCWDCVIFTSETGAASGSFRCLRGGGWNSNAFYCYVSGRGNYYPYGRNYDLGFRVVCSAGN